MEGCWNFLGGGEVVGGRWGGGGVGMESSLILKEPWPGQAASYFIVDTEL